MAIYEYECPVHGRFTEEVPIKDYVALKACPLMIDFDPTKKGIAQSVCMKPVKRIISTTSFVLKGKGWASDGYSGEKK
jgi:predicted nucleic acid-binding Zn ribbon protein